MPSRKRNPKPDRRRALELLAGSRDGCIEAIMLRTASRVDMRVVAGKHGIEVARLRITEAGRRALAGRAK